MQWGAAQATPHLIASMSLRLVIPGWVALQQSPLALRQPSRSCQNGRPIERGSIMIAPPIRLLQTKNCKGCSGTKCKGCLGTGHGVGLVGWTSDGFAVGGWIAEVGQFFIGSRGGAGLQSCGKSRYLDGFSRWGVNLSITRPCCSPRLRAFLGRFCFSDPGDYAR